MTTLATSPDQRLDALPDICDRCGSPAPSAFCDPCADAFEAAMAAAAPASQMDHGPAVEATRVWVTPAHLL